MRISIIYIILLFPFVVWGQESVSKKRPSGSKRAMYDLSRSLEQELPVDTIAADYEKVAREYVLKGEYQKAEESLKNARKLYRQAGNKEKTAFIEREIAKVQEKQLDYARAIETYLNAASLATSQLQKELNNNDAGRLRNLQNPQNQSVYIQRNIDVLNALPNSDKEEKSLAYRQLAEANYRMDDKEATFSNMQSAIDEVKEQPSRAMRLKQEMAEIYTSEKQIDKAIGLNEEILEEAEQKQDTKVQIEQLQTLSGAYIENQDVSKGIASLRQAYELALQEGHTLDAKNSLELLVAQYKKQNDHQKALGLYADFIGRLESLVKADSSLIDEKIVRVHEEKIARLEKERELKDELIRKQNNINLILLVSIALILISLFFIGKALFSIKKRNKKIALQSLRREMNPHFLFNSLNSVNQFIAQNNEREANKYLSSYSRLMRNMMENSNKDFTSLSTELEQLKEYLDLEQMRFRDVFSYTVEVDENLDTDALRVPNMLIQPQLENAIWHGLRYRDKGGLLKLSIRKENKNVFVKIEDNGIGLKKSHDLKTKHQKEYKSRGLTNTRERIALLNSLYRCNISMDITEKKGIESGVIVVLKMTCCQGEEKRKK